MTRLWTSDLHVGHHNIVPFTDRPFWKTAINETAFGPAESDVPDVDAMNEALIENWNSVVTNDDEVWVVGDVVMGHFETNIRLISRLNGNKFLIPGNHDRCHKMFPKWHRFQPAYEAVGFTVLDSEVMTMIGGTEVKVCHFPYTGDSHGVDRYSGNRPDDEGHWLIHGHTHSSERAAPGTKMIHVGVDAWDLTPVVESEIEDIISAGTLT